MRRHSATRSSSTVWRGIYLALSSGLRHERPCNPIERTSANPGLKTLGWTEPARKHPADSSRGQQYVGEETA
jgi:hypothetical protein